MQVYNEDIEESDLKSLIIATTMSCSKYFYHFKLVLKLITLRDVEQLEILCFNALNSPKQTVDSIQCLVNWRAVQRKRLPVTEENVWSSLMPFFTRHPLRLC